MEEQQQVTPDMVIKTIRERAKELTDYVQTSEALGRFFGENGIDREEARRAYLGYLFLTYHSTRHHVPFMKAAYRALLEGDDVDRQWAERLKRYGQEEQEEAVNGPVTHDHYAHKDMKALYLDQLWTSKTPPEITEQYKTDFLTEISDASRPYTVLGGKGVLEALAVAMCPGLVAGLQRAGLEKAVRFLRLHGDEDVEHSAGFEADLKTLDDPAKLQQVYDGALRITEFYKRFVDQMGLFLQKDL